MLIMEGLITKAPTDSTTNTTTGQANGWTITASRQINGQMSVTSATSATSEQKSTTNDQTSTTSGKGVAAMSDQTSNTTKQ